MLRDKKLARNIRDLIGSLITRKMLLINMSAIFYVTAWIYILYCLDLWEVSLLKKTILWFLGTAMVLVFRTPLSEQPKYFRKLLRKLLEWTIIIEFIDSFYSFAIWVELLMVPVLLVLIGTSVFSKGDEKFQTARGCVNNMLLLLGIGVFLLSFYETVSHWRSAFDEEHIKDLVFSPLMTILFLPLAYALALYMGYGILFLRLKFQTNNDLSDYKNKKRALVRACRLNLMKLNLAKQFLLELDAEDPLEFSKFLSKIKAAGNRKKL